MKCNFASPPAIISVFRFYSKYGPIWNPQMKIFGEQTLNWINKILLNSLQNEKRIYFICEKRWDRKWRLAQLLCTSICIYVCISVIRVGACGRETVRGRKRGNYSYLIDIWNVMGESRFWFCSLSLTLCFLFPSSYTAPLSLFLLIFLIRVPFSNFQCL